MPHCCMHFKVCFHSFSSSLLRAHMCICVWVCCKYVCCFDLFVAMRCTNHWHAQPSVHSLHCRDCWCCCCIIVVLFVVVAADAVIRTDGSTPVNSHAISARRWNATNAMPSDSHATDAHTHTHSSYSPKRHTLAKQQNQIICILTSKQSGIATCVHTYVYIIFIAFCCNGVAATCISFALAFQPTIALVAAFT